MAHLTECQSTYHMDHGHAEFGGRATTYGAIVPVFCASGYEISGNHRYITCLATGEWSKAVCVPKGTSLNSLSLSLSLSWSNKLVTERRSHIETLSQFSVPVTMRSLVAAIHMSWQWREE